MKALAAIVALSRNRGIGLNGALPWRVPEDLQRFKSLTLGHAIVMGRKTHQSIGKALPGRRNVVVSSQPLQLTGCEVVDSLPAALALVADDALPFIIGGAQLYMQSLSLVTHLFLTQIDWDVEADAFFPELNEREWVEVRREAAATDRVAFIDLVRR